MARLHQLSPFALPSSVAHIDFQATHSGANVFRCRMIPGRWMEEGVIPSSLLVRVQLKEDALGGELVSGRNGVIAGINNASRSVLGELVVAELEEANVRPGALLGIKPGFILATVFMKVKSRSRRSDARLISSMGVPMGISLSEASTVSAGFCGGGTSEYV